MMAYRLLLVPVTLTISLTTAEYTLGDRERVGSSGGIAWPRLYLVTVTAALPPPPLPPSRRQPHHRPHTPATLSARDRALSQHKTTLPTVSEGYTVSPDPSETFGTWEGWGTSLAWWANVFGDRDDLADAIFTLDFSDVTLASGAQCPRAWHEHRPVQCRRLQLEQHRRSDHG